MTARRAGASILALTLAVVPACGRYGVRGAKGPTTTTAGNVGVGSGIQLNQPSSTTAGGSGSASAKPGTVPPTLPARQRASNRVTNTSQGLRIVFTVGTKTSYRSGESFPLDAIITNVSGHAISYEPDPPFSFILAHPAGRTGAVWYDTDCTAGDEPGQNPARVLVPNQQLHLSAMYPGPLDEPSRSRCRLVNDQYISAAVFVLCDRVSPDTGKCDPGSYRQANSLGVALTIGP